MGCNVLCTGCQNWQISHASARTETTRLPVLTPADAVAMARKHKLAGVAFTYNDPVVWIEYVHDVCAAFKEAGLYTAFITAAYLTEAALDYVAPVVDAFKFDLKAASAEAWARLTKVKDPEPAFLMAVRAKMVHGCHVEVVSNVVPELNDTDDEMSAMACWVRDNLGPTTPWHLTRFLPDFELSYLPPTPVATLERGVRLGKAAGLRYVYVGNVPDHASRNTTCPGLRADGDHQRGSQGRSEGGQGESLRRVRRRSRVGGGVMSRSELSPLFRAFWPRVALEMTRNGVS